MAIFIPRKKEFWQRKPTGRQSINWSNSLAEGLVGCYLFEESLQNLTGMANASIGGSATINPTEGVVVDAQNEYIRVDADVLLAHTNADSYTVTQSFQRIYAYGGDYPRYWQRGDIDDAAVYKRPGNVLRFLNTANATLSLDIFDGKEHIISSTVSEIGTTGSAKRAFYANGELEVEILDDRETAAVFSAGRWMMIGNRPDGTRWNGGGNRFVYLHDRYLETAEARALTEAPYQILKSKKTYFQLGAVAAPAATLSGSATASITEVDIAAGGKQIILDLTNDTWVAAGTAFDAIRQDILNGLVSAQNEQYGWNNIVIPNEPVTSVIRDSDTRVIITLEAH